MRWLSILEPWLDPRFHLISQPPPDYDGGDTAQREGSLMLLAFALVSINQMDWDQFFEIQDRYERVVDLLNDPNHPGFLRRWPDPSYWGGQSDRFSRDQAIPNVIGMGLLATKAQRNPSKHLWNFFKDHLKRGLLFTTNTRNNWAWPPGDPRYNAKDYAWKLPDLTVLGFWSLYIRAFQCWPLYPLMLIFDLDFVIDSIIKVLIYSRNPSNNDDINHINCLLQAELVMPTPWSKLAKWIYKFRKYPDNSGNATNSAQATLNAYFRGTNPGPKLEELYAPVTKHYLG